MTWWQTAAVALPGWLACSVLVALAVGRTARIRDRRGPIARPIPLDIPTTDEWRRVVAATDRED